MKNATGPSLGCFAALVTLVASIGYATYRPLVGIPLVGIELVLCVLVVLRVNAMGRAREASERARLQAIAPPVGGAWRRLLEAEGLGSLVDEIAPHVRAAVRIATTRVDAVPLGVSRIGGVPDVPADMKLPSIDNAVGGFVAQINLEEVRNVLPECALPRDGYLWFFQDFDLAEGDPVNVEKVFYRPKGTALARFGAVSAVNAECALTFEAYEALPEPIEGSTIGAKLDELGAAERYDALCSYLSQGTHESTHKLLGYAEPLQGPMELECQLAFHGLDTFTGEAYSDPRAKALAAGASDWRLLLQVESDENANMMWGDAGKLYYWIREEDLRAGRFDRVQLLAQCY